MASTLSQQPGRLNQALEAIAQMNEPVSSPVVMRTQNIGRVFDGSRGPMVALENVSFEVRQREFICVIGPSGCGKSTLIRILAGLDQPTSGEVLLDGKPVDRPGRDRGMVFQRYTLFPWLTVAQNVMFGLKIAGMKRARAVELAAHWLDLVGLAHCADHYPEQLSGGMKQRVAIARALANQPRILLMDEPFGALDAQTRSTMQSHLLRIWQEIDVTVLFITHDLDEAVFLADRIVVLGAHPGRVLETVSVPVPRPRHREQMRSQQFWETRQRLEDLIHPSASSRSGERLISVER
jgi:NitT/TauT family transport system ATP-binding protein